MIHNWILLNGITFEGVLKTQPSKQNSIINYIKYYCQEKKVPLKIIRQYFLLCRDLYVEGLNFKQDSLKNIEFFLEEFDKAIPEKIPKSKYFGPTWDVGEKTLRKSKIVTSERKRTINIVPNSSKKSPIRVNNVNSPFPGYVSDFPLLISNLSSMKSDGCLKVTINSITSDNFENLYENYQLEIPNADEDSVKIWIENMLSCFYENIKIYGISLI